MRSLLLVGVVALTFPLAGLAACSDASAPMGYGVNRNMQGNEPAGTNDTTGGGTTGSDPGTSSGSGTSGTSSTQPGTTTADGGADAGAAKDSGTTTSSTDPFAGAGAFVAQTASSTHHAGEDCMGGCHNHGFTFAGTAHDAAGNALAGAEVRLVDKNGQAILVHTGPEGNFHSSTAFAPNAYVGVRTATTKAVMTTALKTASNGGCNGCHATGGTQSPIHVP